MPIFDNHLIIYSPENQLVAENIAATYLSVGKEAVLLARNPSDFSQQLGAVKRDAESAVLLLISDNSLKSYGCMNGALQAAHKWGDEDRLIAIITDGAQEGLDGNVLTVKTKFERVEDIIQYLNYWQDQYLELRKMRRDTNDSGELDDQIAVTKDIAGEIGEFLRFIRNYGFQHSNDFVTFIEDSANSAATDNPIPDGAALLPPKKWGKKEKSPEETERDLVEMIQKSSEELLAELMIENKKKKETKSKEQFADELTEELLKKIPGLSLLAKQKESEENDHLKKQEEVLVDAKKNEKGFSKNEMEKLDNENDELMSILDEVLQEAGIESENDDDDDKFEFIGDDPENPYEFNLDALMDDDEPIEIEEKVKPEQLSENEVLLNLIDEEEDGISFSTEAETQEILEEAIELFQENHIEEGIKCFEEAVDDFPGDTTLRYYFAYSLAKFVNDFEAAKAQLGVLLKQDNSHPDAWFLLAELAENQQDFEGAKICFERTIDCDDNYPNVHYRLGLLLIEHFEKEEEMAANLLKIAIERDPENADAEYMLATVMNEMLGEPELSIPHFKKALAIHPKHPFANYDLALLYHQFGDKERASKYYHEAIAINPELGTPQNDEAFDLVAERIELESENLESLENENNEALQEEPLLIEQDNEEPVQQTSSAIAESKAKQTKTVLITGGTAGIGKATAEIFARNGYRVIITGRREERLSEISKSFSEKYKAAFHTLSFDVRELESVKSAIDNLPEEWKDIDILINNAGLSKGLDPIQEGNIEDWDSMIDTNVKGLLYITRAVSPQMVERKSGHIINVSSIAGTEVYPGGNVYCASKAAVSSLTRSMRLDLHQHNIRVSQVAPGHVEETEFARVRFDWDTDKAEKVYENFQPLKSSDIAETIYFIATRPAHVNIQDIYMYGTQQACATMINRSGR